MCRNPLPNRHHALFQHFGLFGCKEHQLTVTDRYREEEEEQQQKQEKEEEKDDIDDDYDDDKEKKKETYR